MMHHGHMPGQSEAEANAFRLAAYERLEQSFAKLLRRPGAGIRHLDRVGGPLGCEFQGDRTARPGGLNGIKGQVEHRGAEAGLVGHGHRDRRVRANPKCDASVLAGRLNQGSDVVQQSDQVTFAVRSVLKTAQCQEAANMLFHQGKLAQGDCYTVIAASVLAALEVKLNAQPGARERISKLMCHTRRELSEHRGTLGLADRLTHLLELRAHLVDRPGQVVKLVTCRLRVEQKLPEVAFGNPGDLVLQTVDSR